MHLRLYRKKGGLDARQTLYTKLADLKEPAACYKGLDQINANKCRSFLQKKKPTLSNGQDLQQQELEEFTLSEGASDAMWQNIAQAIFAPTVGTTGGLIRYAFV